MQKTHLHLLIILLFTSISATKTLAQTTYTWNVAKGDWSSPASWLPNRNTPLKTDILVFDGLVMASDSVTNIPSDSIGRLRFINGANVVFSSATFRSCSGTITRSGTVVTGTGTNFIQELIIGDQIVTGTTQRGEIETLSSATSLTTTLSGTVAASSFQAAPRITLSGGANPALEIQQNATLTIACNNPATTAQLTLHLGTGATGSVNGTLVLGYGTAQSRNRIFAADSAALVFNNGSQLFCNNVFGNIFTAVGRTDCIKMDSGSVFVFSGTGSNPFGLAAPNSKVIFTNGSTYRHQSTSQPVFTARRYGNVEINLSTFNQTTINTPDTTWINNLILTSATGLGFNSTASGTVVIRGNITVNSGSLTFGSSSTATQNVILNGTTQQVIQGSGFVSFGNLSSLTLNNPAGFLFSKRINPLGSLRMTAGLIDVAGDTLQLGDATNFPSLTYTSGRVINGALTRSFSTSNINIAADAGLFPVGTATVYAPFRIGGTPANGGFVSGSYIAGTSSNNFGSPFSDNATNNVTVNTRQNSRWVLSTSGGLTGSAFSLRLQGVALPGEVNNTTDLRITLATGIAPGTAQDGSGTTAAPQANRGGLSESNLINTFYIGGNSAQNPLPAKLISLQANAEGRNVALSWTTASELNVATFTIEKSSNGNDFTYAGQVRATGGSHKQEYLFNDVNALKDANTLYYRIVTTDNDNSKEYSPVAVVNNSKDPGLHPPAINPNPFTGNITIAFDHAVSKDTRIVIRDMQGREVYTALAEVNESNSAVLQLESLDPGLYLVHISGGGLSLSTKIRKQ